MSGEKIAPNPTLCINERRCARWGYCKYKNANSCQWVDFAKKELK